jgi:sugar transferase (PEP-CTERM system associated)
MAAARGVKAAWNARPLGMGTVRGLLMSLDGASPKSGPLSLQLVHTSNKSAAKDELTRRLERPDKRPDRDRHSQKSDNQSDNAEQSKRRYPRYIPAANVSQLLLDVVLIAAAQAAVFLLIYDRLGLVGMDQAGVVVCFSVVVLLLFLYATGCYRRDAILSTSLYMSRLPIALAFTAVVSFGALHYLFPYLYPSARVYLSVSRDVTILLIGTSISFGAALVSRAIIRVMLNVNLFRRRVLVIGTGKRARYIHELNESHAHGTLQEIHFASEAILKEAVGRFYTLQDGRPGNANSGSAIDELSKRLTIDEVVLALDDRRGTNLDGLVQCKAQGFPVTDFNSFIERMTGRIDLAWLEISWLLHSSGFQMRLIDVVVKRAIDVVLSSIALFVSLPVLLLAMLAIRLDSRGPVFYRQQRVTLNGRVFWLFKLRTMEEDAETNGPQWADEKDKRITRVGAFLRRTRLDEIPQLLNILWGDMSIVGPRPERPCFVDELSHELRLYNLRHSVRAGLTGWAQISYRYGASLEDSQRKLEYDLFYIKNFSLLRDCAIMLQTLRVLLWPEGVR